MFAHGVAVAIPDRPLEGRTLKAQARHRLPKASEVCDPARRYGGSRRRADAARAPCRGHRARAGAQGGAAQGLADHAPSEGPARRRATGTRLRSGCRWSATQSRSGGSTSEVALDQIRHVLGHASYEYFLSQFASAEGKKGGEFYTPRCVVKLALVEMLEPYRGRVYDPCCGGSSRHVRAVGRVHRRPRHGQRQRRQGARRHLDLGLRSRTTRPGGSRR